MLLVLVGALFALLAPHTTRSAEVLTQPHQSYEDMQLAYGMQLAEMRRTAARRRSSPEGHTEDAEVLLARMEALSLQGARAGILHMPGAVAEDTTPPLTRTRDNLDEVDGPPAQLLNNNTPRDDRERVLHAARGVPAAAQEPTRCQLLRTRERSSSPDGRSRTPRRTTPRRTLAMPHAGVAEDTPPRVTRGHCRDNDNQNHELDEDGPPAQEEVLNNNTPRDEDRAQERDRGVVVLHAGGEPSRAAAEPIRCQRCSCGRVEAQVVERPPVERRPPVELPPFVLDEEDIFCLEFDAHEREESVGAKGSPHTLWGMEYRSRQCVWRARGDSFTGKFATDLEKALWNYSLAQILRDPAEKHERGQNVRLRAFLKYQLEEAIRQFAGDMWPRPVKMAILVGDMEDASLSGPPKDFDSLFTRVEEIPENLHRVYFARTPPGRVWAAALGRMTLLPYDPAAGVTTGYVQIDNSEFTLENPLPDGTPRFVPKLDPLGLVYQKEQDDSGIDVVFTQSMVCACDWQSRSGTGPGGLPLSTCGGLSVDPEGGVFAAFLRYLMRPHGVQVHQLKSESNNRGWGPLSLQKKLRGKLGSQHLAVATIGMLPDACMDLPRGGAAVVLAPSSAGPDPAAGPAPVGGAGVLVGRSAAPEPAAAQESAALQAVQDARPPARVRSLL